MANHIQAVIDGIDLQADEGILSHKEGVDLMPANIDLASMEMGIFMAMSREQILNTWLSGIKDNYDYVLIDCAPTRSSHQTACSFRSRLSSCQHPR